MPDLSIDDLTPDRFDTVIVAGVDMQGRLFGRRLPARRFLADPAQGVDICTCVFVWDIAEDPGADVPFRVNESTRPRQRPSNPPDDFQGPREGELHDFNER